MSEINELKINQDDILFFVDESGDEKMGDDANPIFIYGGLAIFGYELEEMKQKWNQAKLSNGIDVNKPCHSNAVLKKTKFINFFKEKFYRFYVSMNTKTELETGSEKPEVIFCRALINRFKETIFEMLKDKLDRGELIEAFNVYILFEDSYRGNDIVKAALTDLQKGIACEIYGRRLNIPVQVNFIKKENCILGTDIAHQICYAAGVKFRGNESKHIFYKRVFKSVAAKYVRGFNIDSIKKND